MYLWEDEDERGSMTSPCKVGRKFGWLATTTTHDHTSNFHHQNTNLD